MARGELRVSEGEKTSFRIFRVLKLEEFLLPSILGSKLRIFEYSGSLKYLGKLLGDLRQYQVREIAQGRFRRLPKNLPSFGHPGEKIFGKNHVLTMYHLFQPIPTKGNGELFTL